MFSIMPNKNGWLIYNKKIGCVYMCVACWFVFCCLLYVSPIFFSFLVGWLVDCLIFVSGLLLLLLFIGRHPDLNKGEWINFNQFIIPNINESIIIRYKSESEFEKKLFFHSLKFKLSTQHVVVNILCFFFIHLFIQNRK